MVPFLNKAGLAVFVKLRSAADREGGQTLIMLLSFMATAIILTTTAAAVTVANITANSQYTYGERAYQIAQTGIDNAVLRLVRDPAYAGETLDVGDGTVIISISGSTTKTITATATAGNFSRTIVATAEIANNTVTLTGWNESP